MGRRSGNPDPDAARYCARHQGGADGYDRGGAYWGTPADVWAVWAHGQPDEVAYVRAPCAAAAIREVTGRDPEPPIRPTEDAADFLATVLWLRNCRDRDERPKRYSIWSIHEVHAELIAAVRAFCRGFREYLEALPDPLPEDWESYLVRSFGGSVYFTLSGHGCSFRDEYSDPERTLGDRLADALCAYAGSRYQFEELEHTLCKTGGKIHLAYCTAAARREYLARTFRTATPPTRAN